MKKKIVTACFLQQIFCYVHQEYDRHFITSLISLRRWDFLHQRLTSTNTKDLRLVL